MAIFKKKGKVVDLSQKYHAQQEQLSDMRSEISEAKTEKVSTDYGGNGIFNMFGGVAPVMPQSSASDEEISPEEKKRRLSKRLLDMTNKIEDMGNQIYHLQQRIEALERKSGSGY